MPDVAFPNLGIEINEMSRVAFTAFGLPIYWYGIIIATGVLAGLLYTHLEAKRTGQDPATYSNFLLIAIVTCIIGARLYFVIFSWDNYKDNLLEIFNLRNGGLAIYGAVIAAVITGVIFTKKNKLSFYSFADTAAPALILGQAIGRWGNFFNREAFGGFASSDNLLAMQYKISQVEFIPVEIMNNKIGEYIQVHPTFLYESLWNLGIFLFMVFYKRHKKFDGEIFWIYFVGYGIGRSWIEALRQDQLLLWGTNIPVSLVLSLALAILGIVMIVYNRIKIRTINP